MNRNRPILGSLISLLLAGCGAVESADAPGAENVGEADQAIIPVAGAGYYCSTVWPSTNGWTFNWTDINGNPCSGSAGAKVVREGVFSWTGMNTVVARCDPNYFWIYAGVGDSPLQAAYHDASTTQTGGGCVFTVNPGLVETTPPDGKKVGCADGTVEQSFGTYTDATGREHTLIGCAGAVTWDLRASPCADGWKVATSSAWIATGGAIAPAHDYWTDDNLGYAGTGSGSCSAAPVSSGTVTSCPLNQPMRVCTATGNDAEGNHCNWIHCGGGGLANAWFGGCVGNSTAGALCEQPTPGKGGPPSAAKPYKSFDVDKFAAGVTTAVDAAAPVGYQLAIYDDKGVLVKSIAKGEAIHDHTLMSASRRLDVVSMSKTITAVAVMAALEDLQKRGVNIGLDSSIAPYLPSSWYKPASVQSVTFRKLLLHTSGLSQAGIGPNAEQNRFDNLRIDIASGPVGANVGMSLYSNAGYALFRVILPYLVDGAAVYAPYEGTTMMEDLTAESYRTYVRSRIFDPIGLTEVDEFFTGSGAETEYFKRAPNSDQYTLDLPPDTNVRVAGPGTWTLSAAEYGHFLASLRSGKIVSSATFALMQAGQGVPGTDVYIGMWGSNGKLGKYFNHNGAAGSDYGPVADWMMFPNGFTAVLVSNTKLAPNKQEYTYLQDAFDAALTF
ncbi:MAG: serine hydrolase domain-containing protein [Minicystis sp.]